MASVIFMTTLLVYGIGTYAVFDPMLLLWMVAEMLQLLAGSAGQHHATAFLQLFAARCGLWHGIYDQRLLGAGRAGAGDCTLGNLATPFGSAVALGAVRHRCSRVNQHALGAGD